MITALVDHPLACLFPLLAGDEFHHLVADVKAHGLLHPIVIHQGMILDGRNRYRACVAAGVPVRSESYAGDDPAGFVISSNLHRRHLDESQRAMIAANLADMQRGSNQHASIEATSQTSAAEKLNVSRSAVQRAVAVRERGIPELCNAVEQGKIAVSVAAKLALLPEAAQQGAVAKPDRAKHLAKQHIRAERELLLGAKQLALPDLRFGVIVEDYEWDFEVWSRDTGMDRHAANHYSVGQEAHTAGEIVERTRDRFACAADNCVLFMWTTVPHLAVAIDVMRRRGFRYVSNYTWAKDKAGTGHWNRNKHEHLLIGVKGNIPAPAPGTQWDSLITAAVGEHSAKPERFLEMVETYFPSLPKIELNRRGPPRPGWHAWGNQVDVSSEVTPGDSCRAEHPDWLERDSIGSYYAAIAEIGKRVRAGEPVPECLLSRRGNSDDPGAPA